MTTPHRWPAPDRRSSPRLALACLAVCLLPAMGCQSKFANLPQPSPALVPEGQMAALEGDPLPIGIDERTQKLLGHLESAFDARINVRFQFVETVDVTDEHGRKVQYSHRRVGSLARPQRIKLDVDGDLQKLSVWKDTETITVLDRASNTYRVFRDDVSLSHLSELLDLPGAPPLPLHFYLADSPAADLMEGVVTGEYLGEHMVGEALCDHIVLSTPTRDKQLWIEKEGRRRPIKLIETFRALPGQPQYAMQLEISTLVDSLPDSLFEFTAPEGAFEVSVPKPAPDDGGSTP